MEASYLVILLCVIYFCFILPTKRRKNRRRMLWNKERKAVMNELIENMIGKRCEIIGDVSTGCIGTILSVKDNWIEVADDKGRKKLINTYYISTIRNIRKKKNKTPAGAKRIVPPTF